MPQTHAGGDACWGSTSAGPELHRRARRGRVRIGALARSPSLRDPPCASTSALADACDHFASDQLRNAATIGGNVCNASPAGDPLVPLLALDAEAELASKPDGRVETRRVPLADFFTGPGRTARAPNELLCAIRLPLPPPGFVGRFFKFGTRPALDISAISIAIGGVRSGRALTHVRVAYGAVAPVPLRARKTEAALEGAPLDAAAIDRIAATARDEVRPIDDVRASAWYRKELVFNMTRRILGDVAQA
jgi:CO/xanthine dehydrogenase FAD-binding subunit